MALTIMELWMALDKATTLHVPLLREYSTGLPLSLFEPLLLPKEGMIERLHKIEQYIARRKDAAKHPSSLIFEKANTPNSFAIRYFDQSAEHKSLKLDIERDAERDRNDKVAELKLK